MKKDRAPTSPSDPFGAATNAPWILVVDDDSVMLDLIEIVLTSEGWPVRLATSGAAAFAVVEAAATPPTRVISDVVMTGVEGLVLTRRLLARLPGLKAIVISALLEDVAWWPEDLRECPFLAKPFKNDELVAAVRKALSG